MNDIIPDRRYWGFALHRAGYQALTSAFAFLTAKATLAEVDWMVVASAMVMTFLIAIKPYLDPNNSYFKYKEQ